MKPKPKHFNGTSAQWNQLMQEVSFTQSRKLQSIHSSHLPCKSQCKAQKNFVKLLRKDGGQSTKITKNNFIMQNRIKMIHKNGNRHTVH